MENKQIPQTTEKKKRGSKLGLWLLWVLVAFAVAVFAVLIVLIVRYAVTPKEAAREKEPTAPSFVTPEPETVVVYKEVEKLVEVEKVFTGAMIQEKLNRIGVLLTGEYLFTDVASYSSKKSVPIFGKSIELPFSESGYIFSYEGSVRAGLDFGGIAVELDETHQVVRVTLPAASLQGTVIDFGSFELYDEHTGLFNPTGMTEYNQSMIELEQHAERKAVEQGILKAADENAKQLITNLVFSLLDPSVYELRFVSEGGDR